MMRLHPMAGGWRFALLLAVNCITMMAGFEAGAETGPGPMQIQRRSRLSSEQRSALQEAARELQNRGTVGEQRRIRRVLRALRQALPDFSRLERRLILRRAVQMPPAQRQGLRRRLLEIDELDSDARSALETELREMLHEQADEIHRFEQNVRRWQEMSEKQRDTMRSQMRRFRGLPVDERKRLLDQWLEPGAEAVGEESMNHPR